MREDIISEHFVTGLNQGSEVRFKVYKDPMGLGAYDITNADGTAIHYQVQLSEEDEGVSESEEETPHL